MSQKEFEIIENYLTGKLPLEEKINFEKEISSNSILKEKVENIRIEMLAIEEVTLREKLNTIHQQLDTNVSVESGPKKVFWLNRNFAIAATVAFLVAFGYQFLNSGSQHEKLYADYFTPDPGLVTPMSATDNYEFFRGMVDYKRGEYELAINRWQDLLIEKPDNDSLNYFIGMTLMAQEKLQQAKPYLQSVTDTPLSIFNPEVHYYIGLIALNEGNTDKAKSEIQLSEFENTTQLIDKLNDM